MCMVLEVFKYAKLKKCLISSLKMMLYIFFYAKWPANYILMSWAYLNILKQNFLFRVYVCFISYIYTWTTSTNPTVGQVQVIKGQPKLTAQFEMSGDFNRGTLICIVPWPKMTFMPWWCHGPVEVSHIKSSPGFLYGIRSRSLIEDVSQIHVQFLF